MRYDEYLTIGVTCHGGDKPERPTSLQDMLDRTIEAAMMPIVVASLITCKAATATIPTNIIYENIIIEVNYSLMK